MNVPRSCVLAGVLLALGLAYTAGSLADEPKTGLAPLPPALSKAAPEGPDDLRAIEKQLQAVVAKVTPAVVGVRLGASQGSGVIITKDGYVLTAGHVSGKPGREVQVILPSGRKLKAITLGHNSGIDSGLIKITDKGDWPHVEMGKSKGIHRGEWVIAIGHPGGFRPTRTPVVRLGRVLFANRYLIRSDCTLVGGDSGGPLFDMEGHVIGIHSRIGGSITENVDVPVDTYRETWDRLVKSETWGNVFSQGQAVKSPGGKVVLEVSDKLTPEDPRDSRQKDSHRKVYKLKMAPGSVYTIDLTSPRPWRLDPYLRVEDSRGTQLAEDDDSGGNLNARLIFRPKQEDEYRIIATSYNARELGPFKLIVRQADLRATSVAGRVDVLRTLGLLKSPTPRLLDKLGKAGAAPYANLTLFDAKGNLAPGKDVPFRWAMGSATLKTDAAGVARLELKNSTAKDLFAEVPAGYKGVFELTDASGNLFPLDFSRDASKEKVKSAGGKLVLQADSRLGDADAFDTGRKQCRRQVFLFNMVPSSAYTIDLDSSDFDAYLRLEDSSGKQLAEDDDSGGRLNARLVFRPMREDTYRIIVTTCDPGQSGEYRLTVHQAPNMGAEKKQ